MRVACPPFREMTRQEFILASLEEGRRNYERGLSRSACRNQDELFGYDSAEAEVIASLSPLQDAIDFGEHTAELEDWLIDVEWLRGGW